MDLAYSKEHIDTFVVVSGDSDFSPLVSKLKELGKRVIGLGMQDSTSELLRDNCDEFIYYEDLGQSPTIMPQLSPQLPEPKKKAFALLLDALLALRRENKEVLWSSMIKDTIKRKKPSFNEAYHGYRTFSEMLEDAQTQGLLELDTDKRSRTYVVTRFGSELSSPALAGRSSHSASGGDGRRRRTRRPTRRRESATAPPPAVPAGTETPTPPVESAGEAKPPTPVAEVPRPELPPAKNGGWTAALELGIDNDK
jgi:hypothetical protein